MHLSFGNIVILLKWLLTKQATSVAIDITHRCNLRCQHCYWWLQDHPVELDDQEMIRFMKGLRSKGLRAAILYGGEPTLRPRLCQAATQIFDTTLIFTNGTNGFPEINRGQWILSLDGTRDANDSIRGAGVYDAVVNKLHQAPRPPIVHMTISRLNQNCIDNFVKEMLELPVMGLGFSFYTPLLGSSNTRFHIPLTERNHLVMHLLSLRHKYGEKIGFTRSMAHQLLTDADFFKWNRYSSCPVRQRVLCFKSNGQPKACTYGDDADCSRCGCAAVVAYRGAFKPLDYETLRLILGLMVPEYQASSQGKTSSRALPPPATIPRK